MDMLFLLLTIAISIWVFVDARKIGVMIAQSLCLQRTAWPRSGHSEEGGRSRAYGRPIR
ncbi:MAG: hypothetical protein Q9M24_03800 [Mariprofundaceae bacterium]|nr:hypothetical protein [Mariprofundaceae bacterium]